MCSFALLLPVEVCCIALLLVTDVLSLGTSALPIPWEWIATTLGVDLALLGLLVGYTVYRNVLCGGRAATTSGGGRGRAGSGEGERPLLDPLGARRCRRACRRQQRRRRQRAAARRRCLHRST